MRVAILGASRYNVPVIQHLREVGFHVVAIDGNASAPGLAVANRFAVADIRNADALREAVLPHNVDRIVTLGEAAVRSTARVCTELGLPTITEEAAHNATSKIAMRRCWDAIPEYSVQWRHVTDEAAALTAADAIGYPVIVKPDRTHGGSRGVTRADTRDELIRAFAFAQTSGMTPDVIVEQFIQSLAEYSAEVLIGNEVKVIAIGEKIKTRPPYRVDLSVLYPSDIDITDMCKKAVEAIGLKTGVAHIELAMTNTGPKLLELGARCGGGHTPLLAYASSGIDEIAEVINPQSSILNPQSSIQKRGAEYRFVTFPPGTIKETILPPQHKNIIDAAILATPGTTLNPIKTGADRPAFIASFGEDREEARRVADWAMERMAIRYDDGVVRGAIPLADLR